MTTYEKCCVIRRTIVNRAADVMAYDWSYDIAARHIKRLPLDLRSRDGWKDLFTINPADMTDEELESLDFVSCNSIRDLRLIPLWLVPFMENDISVKSIIGVNTTINSNVVDKDCRFGCLAYGIFPKDKI